jgi:nucleoside-diphosphate-sugar epimerase
MADPTSTDVLITGAAGFIGGALLDRLRGEGRTVVGADLNPTGDLERLDITDAEGADALLARVKPRMVVHAAAVVDDRGAYDFMERVNVGGTRTMLEAARKHGVERFVHLSSIAALGFTPPAEAGEEAPLVCDTGGAYFDTKARAERAARDAHAPGTFDVVCVRPGDVWGPGSNPWVIRPLELMKGVMPVLVDGGRGSMTATWIDNLVDGIVLCLDVHGAPGHVFTFHDGLDLDCKTYLTRLCQAAGVAPPRAALPKPVAFGFARLLGALFSALPGDPPVTYHGLHWLNRRATYSLKEAREILGWAPQVGLDEGMRRLAAHLRG